MTFVCLFIANIYYELFDKLQKRPPLIFQIITGSIITTHYGKYGELLEGSEDQLILDNNEIARDIGDTKKTEDTRDR